MRALLGAALGFGVSLGMIIVVAAWTGALTRTSKKPSRTVGAPDRLLLRALLALAGAAVVLWWTRWVAAGAAAFVAGWLFPSLVGLSARRKRQLERSEAVAVWAEMLRDLLTANAGLREAIAKSARYAPDAIATEVRALEVRAQRGELAPALRRFADDLQDPVADTVVVSLIFAEQRAVSDLATMLAATAKSARESVAMQLRINAARSRIYRNAQLIAIVIGVFVAAITLINRDYLEPFGTLVGQVALTVIIAIFASAVWLMLSLSKPAQAPRLFQVGDRT